MVENVSQYARELAAIIEAHFRVTLSDRFVRQLIFEAVHADLDLQEEIGQILVLECCEMHSKREPITEESLLKAAHRIRVRLVRHSQRDRQTQAAVPDFNASPSADELPEPTLRIALSRLLDALSAEESLVFHAFYFEKRTPAAIAAALSLAPAKVYRHLSRTKQLLTEIAHDLPL